MKDHINSAFSQDLAGACVGIQGAMAMYAVGLSPWSHHL